MYRTVSADIRSTLGLGGISGCKTKHFFPSFYNQTFYPFIWALNKNYLEMLTLTTGRVRKIVSVYFKRIVCVYVIGR